MDNIYDAYPDSVELDGKTYLLTLGYDRVLRAVDCQSEDVLTPEDKLDLQMDLLCQNPPKDIETRLRLLIKIFDLFPKAENTGERYMDLHQDAGLIRSAFLRGYGVDLTKEHPHYLQFLEMLSDLPHDTAFMRTVELRQKPLPKPNKHNQEEIAALQKAKARVALKRSKTDQEAAFAASLKNAFNSMKER